MTGPTPWLVRSFSWPEQLRFLQKMQPSKSAFWDKGEFARWRSALADAATETAVSAPAVVAALAGANTDKASMNISRTGTASRGRRWGSKRTRDLTCLQYPN